MSVQGGADFRVASLPSVATVAMGVGMSILVLQSRRRRLKLPRGEASLWGMARLLPEMLVQATGDRSAGGDRTGHKAATCKHHLPFLHPGQPHGLHSTFAGIDSSSVRVQLGQEAGEAPRATFYYDQKCWVLLMGPYRAPCV